MDAAEYQTRRATLEDLPALQYLWNMIALPADDLTSRLREFQLVVDARGGVLGGVGVELAGTQGRLYAEVFSDFGFAEHLRPLLWQQVERLAQSHAVTRIWTQETAPFYTRGGFNPAAADELAALPAAWRELPGRWFSLRLREELSAEQVEKQMEAMMAGEREHTESLVRRAKFFKIVATVLAIVFALFVLAAAAYLITKNPGMFRR